MTSLGITEGGLLVYQGDGHHGHPIWPIPVISRATLIESDNDWKRLPPPGALYTLVFREDYFDAVSRIRRGRLYDPTPNQPADWQVTPHPAYAVMEEREANRGTVRRRLYSFQSNRSLIEKPNRGVGMMVALGNTEAVSAWKIVNVERLFSNEDLITLKARSNLGVLPDLDHTAIPAAALTRVQNAVAQAADAAFRERPASIIDRCKDAGAVALGHSLADAEGKIDFLGKDIGALYQHLEAKHGAPRMLTAVARVLGHLHSNAKPNEQHNHGRDPPGEGDAELAIAALSSLLRELRWAKA